MQDNELLLSQHLNVSLFLFLVMNHSIIQVSTTETLSFWVQQIWDQSIGELIRRQKMIIIMILQYS